MRNSSQLGDIPILKDARELNLFIQDVLFIFFFLIFYFIFVERYRKQFLWQAQSF